MVSTRQAGKSRKSAEESFAPADSGDECEERTPEPGKTRGTKRAKTAKTTVKEKQKGKRRKKAKLSMLPEMPIDILYEIFSLVHPRDLMRTSWTARVLNEFLTSKSSRHVWQASFKTIPEGERPPPCPSGMTEMAYANLLYGQCCMNCASVRPSILAWCALVRLCGPCVDEIAMDTYDAEPEGLDRRTVHDVCEILPTFRVRCGNGRTVKKVLCSDIKRLSEELTGVGKRSKKDVIKRYKSVTRERAEFSDAMLQLERVAEKAKEDAREDVQKRRIERIWERLSEEGWGEEIAARKSMYEPGLLKIKGVVMIRPLGEKAWADLRDPLNKFMKSQLEVIRDRLDTQRCKSRIAKVKNIIDSFRLSLPHPHDFSPPEADICWIPEVQGAIIDGTDEEFQDCEADLRSRIPELSAIWLEERRNFFLQLLPQDSPSLEHFSLVTTLFDCTDCRNLGMRIETALSHTCRYHHDSGFSGRFSNVASARAFQDNYCVHGPWNSRPAKFKYSVERSALVREVVLECGENPDTITIQEMNRKHHRIARFAEGGAVTVLNWLESFEQKLYGGLYRGGALYRLLRPDELPEYVPEPEDRKGAWGCLRCWGTERASEWRLKLFSVIKDHLARSHQITNVTQEDYYNTKDPNVTVPFKWKPGNNV